MKVSQIGLLIFGLAIGVPIGGGALYFLQSGSAESPDTHDAHDEEEADAHGDDAQDEHAGESDHVRLSEDQMSGLKLDSVGVRKGTLTRTIELSAEVQWDTDRLVHVSPRVEGVVASVEKTLGDVVEVGDQLCTLDSREMGDARMAFLAATSRFELAQVDYALASKVHGNTRKLLEIVRSDPSSEEALEQAGDLEIGKNKNRLLTSYTRMNVTRRTFERAESLLAKSIGTEQELLEARGANETARVDYLSTREEIAFDLEPSFLRAEKAFKNARTELQNAGRALRIMGVTSDQMTALAGDEQQLDEMISLSVLYSPIAGVIAERHLTRGEHVDPETNLYTIADMSNVWVIGRVYERDVRFLEVGQKAIVTLDAFPGRQIEGRVDYIGSQLDRDTRTVEARVVLANPDRQFRPGMFGALAVFAHSDDGAGSDGWLVPVGALQRVGDGYVVYRMHERGEYEQVHVRVVARSKEYAEVIGDLGPSDQLAVGDTFVLKSEAGKGSMGEGHAH